MGFLLGLRRGPVVSEIGEFETILPVISLRSVIETSGESQSKPNMINTTEEVISLRTHPRRPGTATGLRTSKPVQTEAKEYLKVDRVFSDPKINPFDQLEWERRTAEITDDSGKVIFRQEDVEVP